MKLRPSFKAPQPSILHSVIEMDTLGYLLSRVSRNEGREGPSYFKEIKQRSSQLISRITSQKEEKPDNSFNLFGGARVVHRIDAKPVEQSDSPPKTIAPVFEIRASASSTVTSSKAVPVSAVDMFSTSGPSKKQPKPKKKQIKAEKRPAPQSADGQPRQVVAKLSSSASASASTSIYTTATATVFVNAARVECDAAVLAAEGLEVVSSVEQLTTLVSACAGAESVVGVALVWTDLSSNHDSFTTKVCMPRNPCHVTFCCCHRTVRASLATKPLLGAIILVSDTAYFLPLCKNDSSDSSDSSRKGEHDTWVPPHGHVAWSGPLSTSVEARWRTFAKVLFSASTKVVYSAQRFFLGVRHTLATHPDPHVSMLASTAGPERLFDLRVAAFICNSEWGDKELELSAILTAYSTCADSDRAAFFSSEAAKEQSSHKWNSSSSRRDVAAYCGGLVSQLKAILSIYPAIGRALLPSGLGLLRRLEMPTAWLLASVEQRGLAVDQAEMTRLRTDIARRIVAVAGEADRLAGKPFNAASNDEIGAVLFTHLGLPLQGRTAGGKPAVGEEALLALTQHHACVPFILEHRRLLKLRGLLDNLQERTVVLGAPAAAGSQRSDGCDQACPVDSRVHPMLHLTGAATGRLSASQPNIQQMPKESDPTPAFVALVRPPAAADLSNASEAACVHGGSGNNPSRPGSGAALTAAIRLRDVFVARMAPRPPAHQGASALPHDVLVAADYSQIEVRIIAEMAKDATLIADLKGCGAIGDVYRHMAAQVFENGHAAHVTPAQRAQAKTIVLAQLYGQGVREAARRLGISEERFRHIQRAFFSRYAALQPWMKAQVTKARTQGFVETRFGRRRYLPHALSQEFTKRSASERQAVNTPIQGTASDVIKWAMLLIDRDMRKDKELISLFADGTSLPRLICQIHDELLFEVSGCAGTRGIDVFADFLRRTMAEKVQRKLGFSVPLAIEISHGPRWGCLQKVSVTSAEVSDKRV